MKILILHASTNGHTIKLCNKIISHLEGDVTLLSTDEAVKQGIDPSDFDRIVIGASIYYGHFQKSFFQFIEKHYNVLNNKKTALFTLNVTARKPNKNTAYTNPYSKKLLASIKWQPTIAEVFGGMLDYPNYTFFERNMIRFIMWLTKGVTDTSQSIDYTDYDKLERFAKNINNL